MNIKLTIIFFLLGIFFTPVFALASPLVEPRGPAPIQAPAQVLAAEVGSAPYSPPSKTVKETLAIPEPEPVFISDKLILVDLTTQTLTYSQGTTTVGAFLISSGLRGTPSPKGEFTVLKKVDRVDYKGPNYNFPNTKWNLLFKKGKTLNYYIHGAYWHHNFGLPMSHGCINVSYDDMEPLYNWADVGTKIVIQ